LNAKGVTVAMGVSRLLLWLQYIIGLCLMRIYMLRWSFTKWHFCSLLSCTRSQTEITASANGTTSIFCALLFRRLHSARLHGPWEYFTFACRRYNKTSPMVLSHPCGNHQPVCLPRATGLG
jgi:hypothetical protein